MTTDSYSASTSTAGSANAAELRVGYAHPEVDFRYDVGAAGTVHIEVTLDGTNWHPFDTVEVGSGGGSDIVQMSTTYAGVRVYADGTDFADADVNAIEVVARGDE